MEEADQIEAETKFEEAKQVPKVPNGALQNETSSPDSGHPSSRNFSITSGLSDGSFSTEDSAAPDVTQRSVAAPQASQVKPTEGDSEAPTIESQETKEKGKRGEEKAFIVSESAEITNAEGLFEMMVKEGANLQPETQDNIESEKSSHESTKKTSESPKTGKDDEKTVKVTAAQSKEEHVKQSPHKKAGVKEDPKPEDKNTKMDKLKTSSEVLQENFTALKAPGDEKNHTRGVHPQKEESQATTDSDKSPSAIEMEEIPKAKVSMVPLGRKRQCETPSFSEESRPHLELRQEEDRLSPDGTESILSEPEMESLYPPFDSLAAEENTKSEESTGGLYSVCTIYLQHNESVCHSGSQALVRQSCKNYYFYYKCAEEVGTSPDS